MTIDDVRKVIAAARQIDELAALALRLAAVAGLRRAELAALRWDDLIGDVLTVDRSVEVVRGHERGKPVVRESPTKTANRRRLRLDPDTVTAIDVLRAERAEIGPYSSRGGGVVREPEDRGGHSRPRLPQTRYPDQGRTWPKDLRALEPPRPGAGNVGKHPIVGARASP